jgi:predicted nucleotidyltransferase
MRTLAEASLTPVERRVLERFVPALKKEFGWHLRWVSPYGSRTRGEEPGEDSDVDLTVVSTRGPADDLRANRVGI